MDGDNQVSDIEIEDEARASRFFKLPAVSLGLLVLVILGALIAFDLQDVFIADSRREAALAILRPGERLTQLERELNQAHYTTRFTEDPFPWLRVSTLDHVPVIYRMLGTVAPQSTLFNSLNNGLTNATTFILIADNDGNYIHPLTGDYEMNLRLIKAKGRGK